MCRHRHAFGRCSRSSRTDTTELECFYYAFGATVVFIIADLPDNASAGSLNLAVARPERSIARRSFSSPRRRSTRRRRRAPPTDLLAPARPSEGRNSTVRYTIGIADQVEKNSGHQGE
jgi:hypothetical protein